MLLAIDIGNTNITLGVFKLDQAVGQLPQVNVHWRLSSEQSLTGDDLAVKISALFTLQKIEFSVIKKIVICSVVPVLNYPFTQLCKKYFGIVPQFADNLSVPLKILCAQPQEVGADRIVNAFAARAIVKTACVIVDFGTATTFDCLNVKGEYLGGMIVPGPLLSAKALAQATAKLPKVSWYKPKNVIGNNTVESIQSGLYYGYVALVDGLIDKVRSELGNDCAVLATGGLAPAASQDSKWIQPQYILEDLTLQGLFLFHQNSKSLS